MIKWEDGSSLIQGPKSVRPATWYDEEFTDHHLNAIPTYSAHYTSNKVNGRLYTADLITANVQGLLLSTDFLQHHNLGQT